MMDDEWWRDVCVVFVSSLVGRAFLFRLSICYSYSVARAHLFVRFFRKSRNKKRWKGTWKEVIYRYIYTWKKRKKVARSTTPKTNFVIVQRSEWFLSTKIETSCCHVVSVKKPLMINAKPSGGKWFVRFKWWDSIDSSVGKTWTPNSQFPHLDIHISLLRFHIYMVCRCKFLPQCVSKMSYVS